jgi:hypothetical protein
MLVRAFRWRSRRSISEIAELRRILAFRSFVFWRNIFFSVGFAAWQPLLWWSGGYMMYVDMTWLFHLHTFFSINSHLTGLSNIARASSCRTAAVFRATTSWTNWHCSYYTEAYRSNLSTWKRTQSCQKLSFDSDLWAQTVNCSPNRHSSWAIPAKFLEFLDMVESARNFLRQNAWALQRRGIRNPGEHLRVLYF